MKSRMRSGKVNICWAAVGSELACSVLVGCLSFNNGEFKIAASRRRSTKREDASGVENGERGEVGVLEVWSDGEGSEWARW